MPTRGILLVCLAAVSVAVRAARLQPAPLLQASPDDAPARVEVTLYGEALCPFTAGFVTDTLAPLLQSGFDPLMDLRYVAYGNARRTSGGLECQHGAPECRLNRVINCAQALHPVQTEWLPLVTCLEATPLRRMLAAVNTCAKRAGLDAAELVECADGPQGDALEAAAAAATAALRPPHTYVPWVVVEGVPLGELDDKLKVILCTAYRGERPPACFDSPEANNLPGLRTTADWLPKA